MSHRTLATMLTAAGLLAAGLGYGALTTLVSPPPARAAAPPPAAAGWTTVFRAGFTGRAGSAPAAASWFYDIGTGYGTGETEQTTSSTRNVYVDGHGHLVLKAIRSGATWTSARAATPRRPPGPPRPAGSPVSTGAAWPTRTR